MRVWIKLERSIQSTYRRPSSLQLKKTLSEIRSVHCQTRIKCKQVVLKLNENICNRPAPLSSYLLTNQTELDDSFFGLTSLHKKKVFFRTRFTSISDMVISLKFWILRSETTHKTFLLITVWWVAHLVDHNHYEHGKLAAGFTHADCVIMWWLMSTFCGGSRL